MTRFIAALVFAPALLAQFAAETLPDQDLGRPPSPPFITALGMASPGKLITDPSFQPAGPVAKSIYEELGPKGEVLTSITSIFDAAGHVIEEVGPGSDIKNVYNGNRLISQKSAKVSSEWIYDDSGKLTEFRRSSGDKLQNHDTNFQHDSTGRLTRYEYHQGPDDDLFTRMNLRYIDDKTIESTLHDATGHTLGITTRTVDDEGRVATAEIEELNFDTKRMKPPINVTFHYDKKGRVIEQDTEASKFYKAESEHDLMPGKVFIAYDDVNNTKTTTYSGDNVKLDLKVTHNAAGATIAFTGGSTTMNLNNAIDCTSDTHGNWTSCRQIITTAGEKRVTRAWRRTITYR